MKCIIIPLHHPPPAPCRRRSKQQWRWYRSHLRNNGSTSSSLTSGRPHQTFCTETEAYHLCDCNTAQRERWWWATGAILCWELPHWLTWNGDLWRKTGSRWYRWSSLLIAAHPAQWARSLVGPVAPSRSGSWGMNKICLITNTNERLCDHLKFQFGWFLTIQRSRWAGTLRPCQSTPVCQSPSTGAKWCLTAL